MLTILHALKALELSDVYTWLFMNILGMCWTVEEGESIIDGDEVDVTNIRSQTEVHHNCVYMC